MSGTQSILDIVDVIPAGSADELARIMPLTGDEVVAAFGSRRPTKKFDAVYRDGENLIVDFPRWSGRYTALYGDDRPTALVVWGYSGD